MKNQVNDTEKKEIILNITYYNFTLSSIIL